MVKQFKYLTELSKEELNEQVVIPCIENEYQCILIKNAKLSKVVNVVNTDNLEIRINTTLRNDPDEYYFHIVKSKKNDLLSRQEFSIVFEYLFKKITVPQEERELLDLINSIETYFKITPDRDTHNLQVGVYGELLFIDNMYSHGYEAILEKYHKNFYSKHDVEIDDKNRIEIKTTESNKRIHRFRHDQIHRDDINVTVASYILEESQEGQSLFDMFQNIIELYVDMPDSVIELRKLMKRCGVSEDDPGISISLEKARNDEKLFDAKNLPQLVENIPGGVSGIEYDVDCSLSTSMNVDDYIALIR